MRTPIATLHLVLVALLGTLGCSRTIYKEPQTVTAVTDHTYWAVGSEGFAAFFDGHRFVQRDYPLADDVPDWSYEPGYSDIPAARMVRVDGAEVLITRVGDFLRWRPSGWERLPVRIPGEYDDTPQVDRVLVTDAGRLMVHVHGTTLLKGRLRDFIAGTFQSQELPNYFPWLGFAGGRLYGLGWDSAGEVRALLRYDGANAWKMVARLGRDELFGEPRCVLSWPDGSPFVVMRHALFDPSPTPRTPKPVIALPLINARTTVAEQIESDTGQAQVAQCFSGDGNRALIVMYAFSASNANVLTYRDGSMSAWDCSEALDGEVVGAIPHRDGWTVITKELKRVSLPGPACRPARSKSVVVMAE
jgi:hypothetical protein